MEAYIQSFRQKKANSQVSFELIRSLFKVKEAYRQSYQQTKKGKPEQFIRSLLIKVQAKDRPEHIYAHQTPAPLKRSDQHTHKLVRERVSHTNQFVRDPAPFKSSDQHTHHVQIHGFSQISSFKPLNRGLFQPQVPCFIYLSLLVSFDLSLLGLFCNGKYLAHAPCSDPPVWTPGRALDEEEDTYEEDTYMSVIHDPPVQTPGRALDEEEDTYEEDTYMSVIHMSRRIHAQCHSVT